MKYPKEEMRELIWGATGRLEKVKDSIVGTSRWSIEHEIVFKDNDTGKHYMSCYGVGATEMQEEQPYEYDKDMIEVSEVEEVEETIKVWRAINLTKEEVKA